MRDGWSGRIDYRLAGTGAGRSLQFDDVETADGDDFSIVKKWSEAEAENSWILSLHLQAKRPLVLKSAEIEKSFSPTTALERTPEPDSAPSQVRRVFMNGFQSWTESREYRSDETMRGLNPIFTPWIKKYGLKNYGDYKFSTYEPGKIHGYSWAYLRNTEELLFFGTLSDRLGYTRFEWFWEPSILRISRDCEGLEIDGETPILEIMIIRGSEREVFDTYFRQRNIESRGKPLSGWTSWYRYYSGISAADVRRDLAGFRDLRLPIDVFQIDDGWERAVGDWLEFDEGFPEGVAGLAGEIREAGYRPGLWIAPFLVEEASHIFEEHPDWCVQDESGQPLKLGSNPFQWGGRFYALDIYKQEARDYIQNVCSTAVREWGFDFLKLDFLYAAAIVPRNGKSRGMIMDEGMELLRQWTGDADILGCGVPLDATLGRVEYCRIGSDVALQWEDRKLQILGYRERVSTVNSIRSTIGRRQLNHRAFVNDPDVFFLRSRGVKLTEEQKYSLFLINQIYGSLLFTSDNPAEYTQEELKLFLSQYPLKPKRIDAADEEHVEFRIGELEYIAFHNLSSRQVRRQVPQRLYYSFRDGFFMGGELDVPPFGSRCFLKVKDAPFAIAGSSGVLFPGSDIENWSVSEEGEVPEIELRTDPATQNDGYVYIKAPQSLQGSCRVNGRLVEVEEKIDFKLLVLPRF